MFFCVTMGVKKDLLGGLVSGILLRLTKNNMIINMIATKIIEVKTNAIILIKLKLVRVMNIKN